MSAAEQWANLSARVADGIGSLPDIDGRLVVGALEGALDGFGAGDGAAMLTTAQALAAAKVNAAMTRSAIAERRRVAFHEAAHAVMLWRYGVPITSVTVDAVGGPGGSRGEVRYVEAAPNPSVSVIDRGKAIEQIIMHCAGPIAERIYLATQGEFLARHNQETHQAGAEEMARAIQPAMSERERDLFLRWVWHHAEAEVDRMWPHIVELSIDLMLDRTLSGARVAEILAAVPTAPATFAAAA